MNTNATTAAITTRQKDTPTVALNLDPLRLPPNIAGWLTSLSSLGLSANYQAEEEAACEHIALGPIPAY